jgi:hypothetical protein
MTQDKRPRLLHKASRNPSSLPDMSEAAGRADSARNLHDATLLKQARVGGGKNRFRGQIRQRKGVFRKVLEELPSQLSKLLKPVEVGRHEMALCLHLDGIPGGFGQQIQLVTGRSNYLR